MLLCSPYNHDKERIELPPPKLTLSHIKGSGKKAKEKCEKILVVAGDSNPGPQALATSALTTELRQPSTSKTLTFFLYTVE